MKKIVYYAAPGILFGFVTALLSILYALGALGLDLAMNLLGCAIILLFAFLCVIYPLYSPIKWRVDPFVCLSIWIGYFLTQLLVGLLGGEVCRPFLSFLDRAMSGSGPQVIKAYLWFAAPPFALCLPAVAVSYLKGRNGAVKLNICRYGAVFAMLCNVLMMTANFFAYEKSPRVYYTPVVIAVLVFAAFAMPLQLPKNAKHALLYALSVPVSAVAALALFALLAAINRHFGNVYGDPVIYVHTFLAAAVAGLLSLPVSFIRKGVFKNV